MTSREVAAAKGAPIYLVAEASSDGVLIEVRGSSEANYEALFTVEAKAGENRSLHRGFAKINGQNAVILSSLTLGVPPTGHWSARLRVEPRGSEAYEQIRRS
jgi:hypothetical protein